MPRWVVVALVCLALGSGIGAIATRAAPLDPSVAYDPQKIVLELAPETPRPRRPIASGESAQRSGALSSGPNSTGVSALDALNAAYGVTAWEPGFPESVWPAAAAAVPADSSRVTAREDLSRFMIVHLPPGTSLERALADYGALPGIVGAEPVAIFPVAFTPNDTLFSYQYALDDPGDHDIDAPEAWDVFLGDSTMIVAIVDTGVEYTHPDLGGLPPSTGGVVWTNFAELGGTPGYDDDQNGYVDDVHGWDFVTGVAGVLGEDSSVPDNDPSDYAGHGTLVAGCAGARTNNVSGIAGTALQAKIMPLRVGWATGPNPNGLVDMTFCASAITYAAHNGATVINCSWSNSNSALLSAAVNDALSRGVSVIVAAGNQNTASPPENYLSSRGDCVDVASTNVLDTRSSFSNFGIWVDISAAGEDVVSTAGAAHVVGYGSSSGTSFAAPRVAGAVAFYQGYRKSLGQPPLPPAEMLLRLHDTGDNIDALNGFYAGIIGTRLNLHRLLTDPPTSWIRKIGGSYNSPAVADLDGDGQDEIVIGSNNGSVVALSAANGDTLAGWPVDVGAPVHSSAAIWDVDLDGTPEVIVGTDGGRVVALNGNGSPVPGWPVQLSGLIYAGPAIGDVSPAPGLECVVATSDSAVFVLDRTGAVLPGFPVHLKGPIYGTPALHDFDGDGSAEIVAAGYDSTIAMWDHDGVLVPGWPKKLGNVTFSSPAVGDIDHDGAGDVVIGASDSKVYAFHANGAPLTGWPVSVLGAVRSSPALADLVGNDGFPEVAIASDGPALTVIEGDGTIAPGWPRYFVGLPSNGVAIGDVDGDGGLDLIVGARDKYVHAFHANAQNLIGWPKKFDGANTGPPTLADPDRDGRLELLFASENGVLRNVDFGPGTYNAALLPWPTMHRDFERRGSTSASLVGVPPGGGGSLPAGVRLALRAMPNPARGAMRFELRRARAATSSATAFAPGVSVYSVTGRLVRHFDVAPTPDDRVTVAWDGRDAAGRDLPAGLYFARASWGGAETMSRVALLP